MAYCIFGVFSCRRSSSLSLTLQLKQPRRANMFYHSLYQGKLRLVRWCSSTKRNVSQVSGSADSGNAHVTGYLIKVLTTKIGFGSTRQNVPYLHRMEHLYGIGISAETTAWRSSDRTSPRSRVGILTLPTDSTSASSSLHCVIIHRLLCFGLQQI